MLASDINLSHGIGRLPEDGTISAIPTDNQSASTELAGEVAFMIIQVLLVDDQQIVRQGLRGLLEKQPGIRVVNEAADETATLKKIKETPPDIVVMALPAEPDGVNVTRRIIRRRPRTKVLVLSTSSDSRSVIRMLGAGASGYLLKDCDFEELVHAIHTVASNRAYLSPRVVDNLIRDHFHRLKKPRSFSMRSLRKEGKVREGISPLLAEVAGKSKAVVDTGTSHTFPDPH